MKREQYRQMEEKDLPLVEPKAYENVKQIAIVGISTFVGLSVYSIVVTLFS
ncbi:hypothetical protein SAMN04488168_110158 [Bacillus sp. 491mf]|uniref:hypothetical protein n=1 Tax=unclassified Bacillus (in: firmicutes) TaxID=185979 RepID=UPI0008E6373F|nr:MULTISPECIES: hypothetical protein [unclassified Bacillus (in: firmicutes)]SFC85613.1 hypothetical protein SAMN04488168_110158 [Bacillus sp. 491mf]